MQRELDRRKLSGQVEDRPVTGVVSRLEDMPKVSDRLVVVKGEHQALHRGEQ